MADFSQFSLTDNYQTRLTHLNGVIYSVARQLSDGPHTSVPDGAKRFNETLNRREKYDAQTTTWNELATTYNESVKKLQGYQPSQNSTADTIVLRKGDGRVSAAAPQNPDDVVTLGWGQGYFTVAENNETITGSWNFEVGPTVNNNVVWTAGNMGKDTLLEAGASGTADKLLVGGSYGSVTVSTTVPSGGVDGDIWFQLMTT